MIFLFCTLLLVGKIYRNSTYCYHFIHRLIHFPLFKLIKVQLEVEDWEVFNVLLLFSHASRMALWVTVLTCWSAHIIGPD